MTQTNKNLHRILEEIAEKEIERNPFEFIKKENMSAKANEEFFSFDDDNILIESAQEFDEDDAPLARPARPGSENVPDPR